MSSLMFKKNCFFAQSRPYQDAYKHLLSSSEYHFDYNSRTHEMLFKRCSIWKCFRPRPLNTFCVVSLNPKLDPVLRQGCLRDNCCTV